MESLSVFFIAIICLIILKSIVEFILGGKLNFTMEVKKGHFSIEIFYTLLVIYTIVIIGFGLIYFILSFHHTVLIEYGQYRSVGVLGTLVHSFYFSGVTLLTIGYGDITPVGIGRFIALIQALIGYILPTAFVLKLVQTSNEISNDD